MASSSFHIFLSFVLLFAFSVTNISFAAPAKKPTQSLLLSVNKDEKTNQYTTQISIGTPFSHIYAVLDLGGDLLWFDCESGYTSSTYRPIRCGSKQCLQARSAGCVSCNLTPRPGCTNDTCGVFPYNPFKDILVAEGLGEDVIQVYHTDGYLYRETEDIPHFQFSCAHKFQLKGLAKGTKGMLGLGMTRTSLHKQLALALKIPHKFALCLPRSNENEFGHMFIGGGPYYMHLYGDVSTKLITTPLLINPVSTAPIYTEGDPSFEYFIGVKSIKVDGKRVNLNTTLLSFDKLGNGGTKLSTVNPYTVLHPSIYKALVDDFTKKAALKGITKVAAVAPFGACFSAKSISSSITGPNVPTIDLVLESERVYWRIYGANSMVKVNYGAYCLGFVDGGSKTRISIVLGGYQLEDNFIEFDLETSRLGFTSSLKLKNTSCAQSRLF